MIAHQAIGIAPPALLENFLTKQFHEMLPVGLVMKDCLLVTPASRDVIEGTRMFKPQLASHARGA